MYPFLNASWCLVSVCLFVFLISLFTCNSLISLLDPTPSRHRLFNMAVRFVRAVSTVHIFSRAQNLAKELSKRCPNVEVINVPVGCSGGGCCGNSL